MTVIELNETAHELLALRRQIEDLQAEAEALTDKIKGFMVDFGEEVLTGDGWKASWKNVTSSRLDGKALKAELPEIAERFTKKVTTCRFLIGA